jgi:hypothetical protein
MGILLVLGIAGGITSGVTYFRIDPGGSVPRGIGPCSVAADAARVPAFQMPVGRSRAVPPAAAEIKNSLLLLLTAQFLITWGPASRNESI